VRAAGRLQRVERFQRLLPQSEKVYQGSERKRLKYAYDFFKQIRFQSAVATFETY